tara:strand:- start:66 stop:473 length:408 start_codon:yes stop_codon:yes gene_type:complete
MEYNYGMTKQNNLSYEAYLSSQLEMISKNFLVKTYKRPLADNKLFFDKSKDVRIQIQWKNECIWEFVVEKTFWYQRNTNKEDRQWMRNTADAKIEQLRKCVTRKTPKVILPTSNHKTKQSTVSSTQDMFERMKTQ